MTKEEREEAIAIIRKEYLCVDRDCDIERNCGKCDLMMPSKEPILKAYKMAIQALEQELLCDRLAREYISKVKYCDECFASTFCTINGLRNSRVPQDYCIENIKKYFESKSKG